jgi:hypothetical protein
MQSSSNLPIYDTCAYEQRLEESTNPLQYRTYMGAVENVNKCRYDPNFFPTRNNPTIIDIESELRNQNRPVSTCSKFKYSPGCKNTSGKCMSTFDKKVPVVLAHEVCPIVFNNIKRQTSTGLKRPNGPVF